MRRQLAAKLLGKNCARVQPEAVAVLLGGEAVVEDPGQVLGGDARPGVADLEQREQLAAERILTERNQIASAQSQLVSSRDQLASARSDRQGALASVRADKNEAMEDLASLQAEQARIMRAHNWARIAESTLEVYRAALRRPGKEEPYTGRAAPSG